MAPPFGSGWPIIKHVPAFTSENPIMSRDPQDSHAIARRDTFIAEYLRTLSPKKAAIAAGFSEQTASSIASELLREPRVKEEIRQGLEERKRNYRFEAGVVIDEMMILAMSSMADYITISDGDAYCDLSRLTPEQARCIKEIDCETYIEGKGADGQTVKKVKIKLYDKVPVLRDLAKMLGELKDPALTVDLAAKGGEMMFRLQLVDPNGETR